MTLSRGVSVLVAPSTSAMEKLQLRSTSGYAHVLYDSADNTFGTTAHYPSAVCQGVPYLSRGRWYFEATVLKMAHKWRSVIHLQCAGREVEKYVVAMGELLKDGNVFKKAYELRGASFWPPR